MNVCACIYICMHTYIHISQTYQPRNIDNFRVKYLHSFQICLFPEFLDFKNCHTSGNMEIR